MADIITRAQVVRALAGSRLPCDAGPFRPPGWRGPLPPALARKFAECTEPAAVLVPLIERDTGVDVLFIERAPGLAHHGGQIAFPGGRREAGDADALATALRESQEEIGLAPEAVEVAGYLPPQRTLTTGFAITPVVGFVDRAFVAVPDEVEVAGVFEAPLAFFLDPAHAQSVRRELFGTLLAGVEYRFGSRRIWGATAAILSTLTARIERVRGEHAS